MKSNFIRLKFVSKSRINKVYQFRSGIGLHTYKQDTEASFSENE